MTGILNHQDTKTPSRAAIEPVSTELAVIGKEIVDAAFQVHTTLGPGLLESIYEECFVCELQDRALSFERQKPLSIRYKHHDIKAGYKLDLLVENKIIIELKCVDRLMPIHDAQILTYMKLMNVRLGYLINFNVPLIKDGIKRKAL